MGSGTAISVLGVPAEGLVLCGGAGRRMGGADKGLQIVDGIPAAARTAGLLSGFCGRIFISANRNIPRYEALGIGAVITDLRPGFAGPLAGLEAVAPHLRAEVLLVLPCDLSELSVQVPAALLGALLKRPSLDLVYAATEDRAHYLCAALRRGCIDSLTERLDRGEAAVWRWYASLATDRVLFGPAREAEFRNRNEARDWE